MSDESPDLIARASGQVDSGLELSPIFIFYLLGGEEN